MAADRSEITSIPSWYLEIFQVVQHLDGGLRNAELELREALEIDSLDARVRAEMQGVLDAIHGIKGNLVLVDMTAREVLDQILSQAA
jgi:hypothetical protein